MPPLIFRPSRFLTSVNGVPAFSASAMSWSSSGEKSIMSTVNWSRLAGICAATSDGCTTIFGRTTSCR